jgi:hypothetical protein
LQDIFRFDFAAGMDEFGRYRGTLQPTGIRPMFMEHLAELGVQVPIETFLPQPNPPQAPPPPQQAGSQTRWTPQDGVGQPGDPDRSYA